MKDILLPLLTGLVSGSFTAIVTYFATRSKIRLDLTAEYDKELRDKRREVYEKLWKLLKPLARFSREKQITYQIIKETSEKIRDWYYDTGGIYLSKESREPYFAFKKSMQKIIDNKDLKEKPETAIGEVTLEKMLHQGTELRSSLSDDIGTRKKSWI
jgi:hypothetical protein